MVLLRQTRPSAWEKNLHHLHSSQNWKQHILLIETLKALGECQWSFEIKISSYFRPTIIVSLAWVSWERAEATWGMIYNAGIFWPVIGLEVFWAEQCLSSFEMQWQNSHVKVAIKTERGRRDSVLQNEKKKNKESSQMSAEGSLAHTCGEK